VENNSIGKIIEVIDTLTGPQGCPWDKKQTPLSMCDYLVEECFELVEAIRMNDPAEVAEELGDVLFLLLFVGRAMDREIPGFLQEAVEANVTKMIRRHPHVYGEKAASVAEVVRNWEQIKKLEKAEKEAEKEADKADKELAKLAEKAEKAVPAVLAHLTAIRHRDSAAYLPDLLAAVERLV